MKPKARSVKDLLKTIRKPVAPPAKVEPDLKKYRRVRKRRDDWLEEAADGAHSHGESHTPSNRNKIG